MEQEQKNEFIHFFKRTEKTCVSVVVNNDKCSVLIQDGNFNKEYILNKSEEE